MHTPTLYLMVGYPGSGKTTAAEAIAHITGATHLWADRVRRERYSEPTYSHTENMDLYDHLNQVAAELLNAGNSVVFDTNFNYRHDRDHLRTIANKHGAKTVVIWVQTAKSTAQHRATHLDEAERTRVLGSMDEEDFERLASKLEEPGPDETVITLDGTKITEAYVRTHLE